MAALSNRVAAPAELERFVVGSVHLTGISLGTGAYGSVEEVEIPGARVAAKKLHPELINLGSPQQVHKWITDFVEECKLMSQLRHPHIVQFLGVCYLPGSPLPVLLMEKLQTSLDNLLETSPGIPLDIKVYLLTGTARGVVYLHSHTPPIAHRDLTARNILIDSGMTAKIADLGVAKMVNIQPGQLAATMTRGPGNNLYMPPEATQEEGATHYSITIDIFSFGVVSLFTLTQTFPKDLKPATYPDPVTRRILGRTEIERRENYIQMMKAILGEIHPLVKLTLDCLEYFAEKRPSAVELLRQLEEFERTIIQKCTETKVELIQQISVKETQIEQIQAEHRQQLSEKEKEIEQIQAEHGQQFFEKEKEIEQIQAEHGQQLFEKEKEIEQIQAEHQRQLSEKVSQLAVVDSRNDELQKAVDHLQVHHDYLQNKKQADIRKLEDLITLKEQRLKVQWKEIERLSDQLRLLDPLSSNHKAGEMHTTASRQKLPSQPIPTITFHWKKCKDIPPQLSVHGQPVAIRGKLYVSGRSKRTVAILEYTPDHDQWSELPPPPVDNFTIATLKGQILVVGGKNKSTGAVASTILTYDRNSQQWIQCYPAMPAALTRPAVLGYQDHLIVAGGYNSKGAAVSDSHILNSTNAEWIPTESLPRKDDYHIVLVENTMFVYLVGENSKVVLRAQVPTLLSGAKSGTWELLPSAPYYNSCPVAIGYIPLTVGGSKETEGGSLTTSIQLYDPSDNQWTGVGDLPEPMCLCNCTYDSDQDQLFVLGGRTPELSLNLSVYSASPVLEF